MSSIVVSSYLEKAFSSESARLSDASGTFAVVSICISFTRILSKLIEADGSVCILDKKFAA